MSQSIASSQTDLILPPSIVSKVDISRLIGEVELVDDQLNSAALRARAGDDAPVVPKSSEQLDDLLAANQLHIDDEQQRRQLIADLRRIKDTAPRVHMTFAVSADLESLRQLAAWLRKSIHPQTIIEVGLQPALIGGVYIRTTNHVHDLSLRAQLADHRGILVKELEALSGSR